MIYISNANGGIVMNFNEADKAVIEQALVEAMNNVSDYQAIEAYQEVLSKMRTKRPNTMTEMKHSEPLTMNDGIRYDYDDSSDLRS